MKTIDADPAMQDRTIRREGKPALRFKGEIIGQSENDAGLRGIRILIYQTVGKRFVVHIQRWEGTRGLGSDPVLREDGEQFVYATDLIQWLRNDGGGAKLGMASQQAVEFAAEVNDEFRDAWTEVVP